MFPLTVAKYACFFAPAPSTHPGAQPRRGSSAPRFSPERDFEKNRHPPPSPSRHAAETWFIRAKFARNVGQNGGAALLEGGCPEAFFLNCTFDVS